MIVRSWKSMAPCAAALPLKGLRYDAGSWIAEILNNSWTSYDVVKRRKLSELEWEEWLVPHTVPRLPRDSFGVEEFDYGLHNGGFMMKGWSWQQTQPQAQAQQVQEPQQQQAQQQQAQQQQQQQPVQQSPSPQRPQQPRRQQHPQQRRPLQNHPRQQTSQQPLQTSQQHPKQGHGFAAQQRVNTTYNQPTQPLQSSSDLVDHSQPIPVGQQTQGSHSSQRKARPPPPLLTQPVNLSQPWTPQEQSPVSEVQYYTPVASSPHPKESLLNLPRPKGRRQETSGRAHSGSYPQGNAKREPVACQIRD